MRHQIPGLHDTKTPKPAAMACFWFVWKEHGTGGIHKNHSWSSDLSFWSRSPSKTGPFQSAVLHRKSPMEAPLVSSRLRLRCRPAQPRSSG